MDNQLQSCVPDGKKCLETYRDGDLIRELPGLSLTLPQISSNPEAIGQRFIVMTRVGTTGSPVNPYLSTTITMRRLSLASPQGAASGIYKTICEHGHARIGRSLGVCWRHREWSGSPERPQRGGPPSPCSRDFHGVGDAPCIPLARTIHARQTSQLACKKTIAANVSSGRAACSITFSPYPVFATLFERRSL